MLLPSDGAEGVGLTGVDVTPVWPDVPADVRAVPDVAVGLAALAVEPVGPPVTVAADAGAVAGDSGDGAGAGCGCAWLTMLALLAACG